MPGQVYHSINKFTGDGSKVVWDINFTGGFVARTDVQAIQIAPDGTVVNRTLELSWVSDTQVSLSPAVANGYELQLKRSTGISVPVISYTTDYILSENSLNKSVNQLLFSVQEITDALEDTADIATAAKNTALDTQAQIEAIINGATDVDVMLAAANAVLSQALSLNAAANISLGDATTLADAATTNSGVALDAANLALDKIHIIKATLAANNIIVPI